MTDSYEIVFQMTFDCEKSLKRNPLSIEEINLIMSEAEEIFETGQGSKSHYVGKHIKLSFAIESTLYVVRLDMQKRAIISVDPDEIFDTLIVTLWGVTTPEHYKKLFIKIAQSIYRDYLCSVDEVDEDE